MGDATDGGEQYRDGTERLEKVEAHLYSAINDGDLDDLAHEHLSRAYQLLDDFDSQENGDDSAEDSYEKTWYREDCVHGMIHADDLYPREEITERAQDDAAEKHAALLDERGIEPEELDVRWCTFEDGVIIYKLTHEDMPDIQHEYLPNTGPNTEEVEHDV